MRAALPPFSFSLSRRRLLGAGAGLLFPFGKRSAAEAPAESLAACLPPGKWDEVEKLVDSLLEKISSGQTEKGALGSDDPQPAATSLAVMAFLSRGHAPGRGRYGACLVKAMEFVLSSQDKEGVFSLDGRSQNATYHHALSGLMLGEVYGLTGGERSPRVREAIARALKVSRGVQITSPGGQGMRYFTNPRQADLSVTGAHFLFYRSAKNAEFDVPEEWVDRMLVYVKECQAEDGSFKYQKSGPVTVAMTSVGLLFLVMTGRHTNQSAIAAARWLNGVDLSQAIQRRDYTLYYASLAMSQMGGEAWRGFYPGLVDSQLALAAATGGLASDGDCYPGAKVISDSFGILSLTPPCQVLPIFQR